MKKLVLASVMVMAGIVLASAPTLRAQNSDQITIQNPAEFNAYQQATSQPDPATKAKALEDFLTQYPQSVVKKAVLDDLIDTYQGLGDADKALGAASRLLQVDPNNMKALYLSAFIKRGQCLKSSDAQVCGDAGALAQKGLAATKGAEVSDADWKKLTDATYPIFHSAVALGDSVARQDYKGAIAEYRAELMAFPLDATTKGVGLVDTLQLAEAYSKPGDARDLVQACWFYARAWNFAPAAYKAQIEPKLEYYYKRFHGGLDGLDAIKTASAATLFKPDSVNITPAPTPPEIVHNVLAATPDLTKLNLEDKEFILANGVKEDSDKLWTLLKDQPTPVPGIVIEASATVIKVAVTQDAKDAKVPDFIVNLKKPLDDKDIPAVGFEFKLQPAAELDATYDSFTLVPATADRSVSTQIVLRDGFIQAEKKAAPAHHPAGKPAPGHRPAH